MLEGFAEAVGGGCCRLHMPLKPALAVAGHRLGALDGGGYPPPPSNAPLGRGWVGAGLGANGLCTKNGPIIPVVKCRFP